MAGNRLPADAVIIALGVSEIPGLWIKGRSVHGEKDNNFMPIQLILRDLFRRAALLS